MTNLTVNNMVAVKQGRIQKVGKLIELDGCNAYVEYAIKGGKTEVGKFHVDCVLGMPQIFTNDFQADQWKKNNKFRKALAIPAEMILIRYSKTNAKLQETDYSTFRQWNITAVATCPQRTAMCEKMCYALKAERIYPTVKARRKISLKASQKTRFFVQAMIEQIEYDLANTNKVINFRIHESGDFYSVEYFKAWVEIVNHFKGNRQIVFYTYTKSMDIIGKVFTSKADYMATNMTIKFSEWDDTAEGELDKARALGFSKFYAVPVGTKQEGAVMCPSSETVSPFEAMNCGECIEATGGCALREEDTFTEIH